GPGSHILRHRRRQPHLVSVAGEAKLGVVRCIGLRRRWHEDGEQATREPSTAGAGQVDVTSTITVDKSPEIAVTERGESLDRVVVTVPNGHLPCVLLTWAHPPPSHHLVGCPQCGHGQ